MARTIPSLLAADLVLAYLSTAASITAGVPDADTLPKARMDAGITRPAPALSILASETGQTSGARRTITVICLLDFLLRNADADAPADATSLDRSLTMATAAAYLEQIEARLRDRAAFFAYLGGLDEAEREGWQVISYRTQRQPDIQRTKEQAPNEVTLACSVEIAFAWPV